MFVKPWVKEELRGFEKTKRKLDRIRHIWLEWHVMALVRHSGNGPTSPTARRLAIGSGGLPPQISLDNSRVVEHLHARSGQYGFAVFQDVGIVRNLECLPDILFD